MNNETEIWYELHADGERLTGSQDLEEMKELAVYHDNTEIKRVEK